MKFLEVSNFLVAFFKVEFRGEVFALPGPSLGKRTETIPVEKFELKSLYALQTVH